MNIEDIKKKIDDSAYFGDISPNEIEKDVTYLLSIIEKAEKAFAFYSNQKHWTTAYYHNEFGKAQVKAMYNPEPWKLAESVLKSIQGEG